MMDRIQLMEMVRTYQMGGMTRRTFLHRATVTLGSLAAANTLLAACAASPVENPPPVVDDSQPAAEPGTTPGIVTYSAESDDDTLLMGYLSLGESTQPRPGVIVLQEWWGLNDHIKGVADRFAAAGYPALAPDLYRGVVTTEPDEARKQALELRMRDAVSEIQAAARFLRTQPNVSDRIGVVGFCMGGGLVYNAVAADDTFQAGVGFYGSPLSPADANAVRTPVLTLLGSEDGISATAVQRMHDVFTDNGVPNQFQLYDGARHAFFNDTRSSSYDADAAADAWQRTLAWFATHLA